MERIRRKRVSKKTKKAWRKHSDINDVENFLEDERLQERTGGIVSLKSDQELFFVDRDTQSTVESRENENSVGRVKLLRCHAVLLPDTRIPPARPSREKRLSANHKKKQSSLKDVKRKSAHDTLPYPNAPTVGAYDLWSTDVTTNVASTDEHFLNICRKKRVNPPSTYYNKPSELPAVQTPHPGTSYQPTTYDHQHLIQKAAAVESKRLRDEKRIKRALDDQFPTAADAPDGNTWYKEWVQSDTATGSSDDQTATVSHNLPVRRENKKTERERKQLRLAKSERHIAARQKLDKLHQNDLLRLKSIKKEIVRRELALATHATRRLRQAELGDPVRTRRLGRVKFEEPCIELKLNSERVSCLRQLTPEGSLLRDHMMSLCRRNLMEPRERVRPSRKYKPKVFEKKGHRAVVAD